MAVAIICPFEMWLRQTPVGSDLQLCGCWAHIGMAMAPIPHFGSGFVLVRWAARLDLVQPGTAGQTLVLRAQACIYLLTPLHTGIGEVHAVDEGSDLRFDLAGCAQLANMIGGNSIPRRGGAPNVVAAGLQGLFHHRQS